MAFINWLANLAAHWVRILRLWQRERRIRALFMLKQVAASLLSALSTLIKCSLASEWNSGLHSGNSENDGCTPLLKNMAF